MEMLESVAKYHLAMIICVIGIKFIIIHPFILFLKT